MIDRDKFYDIFDSKIAQALTDRYDEKNAIDMRLFIGDEINPYIYDIDREGLHDLYKKVENDEREWFVDFYENYVCEDSRDSHAEFMDIAVLSNEVQKTTKIYRFFVTNVEYGFIDVEAESEEEGRDKVYAFDGNYFVHNNEITDITLGEIRD